MKHLKSIAAVLATAMLMLTLSGCGILRAVISRSSRDKEETTSYNSPYTYQIPDLTGIPEFTVATEPPELIIPTEPDKLFTFGEMSGNYYDIEVLGIGFKLPNSTWNFLSDEARDNLHEMMDDFVANPEKLDEIFSSEEVISDMAAHTVLSGEQVNIQVQKIDIYTYPTVDAYVDMLVDELPEMLNETIGGELINLKKENILFAGETHPCLSYNISLMGTTMSQSCVCMRVGPYIINIMAGSDSVENTYKLLDNFYSLEDGRPEDTAPHTSLYTNAPFGFYIDFGDEWAFSTDVEPPTTFTYDNGTSETVYSLEAKSDYYVTLTVSYIETTPEELQLFSLVCNDRDSMETMADLIGEDFLAEYKDMGATETEYYVSPVTFLGETYYAMMVNANPYDINLYNLLMYHVTEGSHCAMITISGFSEDDIPNTLEMFKPIS